MGTSCLRARSVGILTAMPSGHHFPMSLFDLWGQRTFCSVGHKIRLYEWRAALGTWLLSRLGKSQYGQALTHWVTSSRSRSPSWHPCMDTQLSLSLSRSSGGKGTHEHTTLSADC